MAELKNDLDELIRSTKEQKKESPVTPYIGKAIGVINITDNDLLAENEKLRQFFRERRNRDNNVHPAKSHCGYKFIGETNPQIIKKQTLYIFQFITNCPISFSKTDVEKYVVRDINKGLLIHTTHNVVALDFRRGDTNWIAMIKLDGNSDVSINPETVKKSIQERKGKKRKGQNPPMKKKSNASEKTVAGVVATPHNDGGYCWACPNCGTGWHNSTSQKGSVFTSTCKKCNHTYSVSCTG